MKNANFFNKSLVLLCLVLLFTAMSVCRAEARKLASEESVKAAILFNLIRFVEWPASAVPNPSAPRVVAFIGEDALQERAVDLVASVTLSSRVSVVLVEDLDQLAACKDRIQVLYIARSAQNQISRILALMHSLPVLTICDDEDFVHRGGMMNYAKEGGRIRFDINLDEAEKSRLKMSAKLFGLARIIVRNGVAKEGH
jgi:hypothetical protein